MTADEQALPWRPLLGIVVLALVLRATPTLVQLPYSHHPDESRNVNKAAAMVTNKTVDPGISGYPGLMYDLGAASFLTWSMVAELRGVEDPRAVVPLEFQTNANARAPHAAALLAMRLPVMVLSSLTAGLAGMIAWLVVRRRSAAVLAALLVAVSAVDLQLGAIVTPDPIGGTMAAAALVGSVCMIRRPSLGTYALTGGFVGLATAAKYNLVIVAVAFFVAHLLVVGWRQPWDRWRWLLGGAASALVAYAVVSPATFLSWGDAWTGFKFEQSHYRSGHGGYEGHSPEFYLSTLLRMFGPALVLVPLAPWIARRHRRLILPSIAYTLVYLVVLSTYIVRFDRLLMAVTAPVAVLIAVALEGARERFSLQGLRLAVATGLVLAVPLASGVITTARALDDPWADAQRWIDRRVPAGTAIAVDGYGPWIDPGRYEVQPYTVLAYTPLDELRSEGVEWFVTTRSQVERYDPELRPVERAAYDKLVEELCTAASFHGAGDEVLVLRDDPDCPRAAGT